MKQLITLFTVLLTSLSGFGQIGFNYKAVIKNSNGDLITNNSVDIRFSVQYLGEFNTVFTSYKEEHNTETDSNGIVILNIGEGDTVLSGSIPQNFLIREYFLLTEIDLDSDGTFEAMPITYFKYVPMAVSAEYAHEAFTAVRADNADSADNVVFELNSNIISNFSGNLNSNDFVFGSSQLNYNGQSNRFYFDKSKGAFRAGFANGNQWDSGNVGDYSTAFGFVTEATGDRSTALGSGTIASRFASTAIGNYNADDQNALFMIGNGSGSTNRNNAFVVRDNGDTILDGELNTTSSGTANMIPIAYGTVASDGSIRNGSNNFTVTYNFAGNYIINLNGASFDENIHAVSVSAVGLGSSSLARIAQFQISPPSYQEGVLVVSTTNLSGQPLATMFTFFVYRP